MCYLSREGRLQGPQRHGQVLPRTQNVAGKEVVKAGRSATPFGTRRASFAVGRRLLSHPSRAISSAHPGWPQLQDSSVVSPAASQYGLQYLLSKAARQLQAGCAHLALSAIASSLVRLYAPQRPSSDTTGGSWGRPNTIGPLPVADIGSQLEWSVQRRLQPVSGAEFTERSDRISPQRKPTGGWRELLGLSDRPEGGDAPSGRGKG